MELEKRRRRGFLLGLLAGQILIIALDVGGTLLLKARPHVRIQAPFGVPSIVFLGMAIGAAIMILAVAWIALVSRRGFLRTAAAMGLTIGVIVGTAWFMIPEPEWAPTLRFAQEQGLKARSIFRGGL